MQIFLFSDSGIGGLLTALGIDWRALLLNGLAFLVVVAIMGKFVYPALMKALDAKKAELDATAEAKQEAERYLKSAQTSAGEIIAEARRNADDILTEARSDAGALMKTTATKAEAQAQRIVVEAREQLARDTAAARQQLRAETVQLVAQATEVIVGEKLTSTKDEGLITRALEHK